MVCSPQNSGNGHWYHLQYLLCDFCFTSLLSYYIFTYMYKQCVYCWYVDILHMNRLGYLNIIKSNKYERIPGATKQIALNLLRPPNLYTSPVIHLILDIEAATGDKQYTMNKVQIKMAVLERK